MTKILLLSDTHGYIGDEILKYVRQADEVWHAGDIGDLKVVDLIKVNIVPGVTFPHFRLSIHFARLVICLDLTQQQDGFFGIIVNIHVYFFTL